MLNMTDRVRALHLIRTVDFGSVLQQQLNDVCVSSSCCPDDGIHTVLLHGDRHRDMEGGRERERGGEGQRESQWDDITYTN